MSTPNLPAWVDAVAAFDWQRVEHAAGTFALGGDPSGTVRRRGTRRVSFVGADGEPHAVRLHTGTGALVEAMLRAEHPARYVVRVRGRVAVVPFDFDLEGATAPQPVDAAATVAAILAALLELDVDTLPTATLKQWHRLAVEAPAALREYLERGFDTLARSPRLDSWTPPAPPPSEPAASVWPDRTAAERARRYRERHAAARTAARAECAAEVASDVVAALRERAVERIDAKRLRAFVAATIDARGVDVAPRAVLAALRTLSGAAVVQSTNGAPVYVIPAPAETDVEPAVAEPTLAIEPAGDEPMSEPAEHEPAEHEPASDLVEAAPVTHLKEIHA